MDIFQKQQLAKTFGAGRVEFQVAPVKEDQFTRKFLLWVLGIIVSLCVISGIAEGFGLNAFNFFSGIPTIVLLVFSTCVNPLILAIEHLNLSSNPANVSVLFAILALPLLLIYQKQIMSIDSMKTIVLEEYGIQLSSLMDVIFIPWNVIDELSIERNHCQNSQDWTLLIRSGKRSQRFALSNLEDMAARQELLSLLSLKVEARKLSSDFCPALKQESYTKIWFASLKQPERNVRNCLANGSMLNNGRFELLEKLTGGGQGTIYLAECKSPPMQYCRFAIKEYVLPAQKEAVYRARSVAALERELAILNQIDHSNITGLREFFMEGSRAYLVFDLLEGTNLRTYVQDHGPLNEPHVIELAEQMCKMLQHLHAQTPAIIHRDFTPDNLMLGADGKLTLIDFSIANHCAMDSCLEAAGKTSYSPVEQLRGQALPASDIYALGCTLYFLISGFDPVPLSQSCLMGKCSPELSLLIADCTSQDPQARPSLSSVQSTLTMKQTNLLAIKTKSSPA